MTNSQRPKKPKQPTKRKQFVAWLLMELSLRGAPIPDETNYAELQRLVEKYLMGRV